MARLRNSKTLERAQLRIASLKSIDPSLDLGNGLTIAALSTLIEETRTIVESYNTALATIDQTSSLVREKEKAIADISERMLFGIASRYGKNSEEFRMVNGPQRSRRRTTAKSGEPTLNSTDAGKKTRSVMSTAEPEVSKNGSHQ